MLLALASAFAIAANPGSQGTVRALLIGNVDYKSFPERRLSLAERDARAIESAIKALDPSAATKIATNRDLAQIESDFRAHLRSLNKGDTSIFYFSGHGRQGDGEPYLIPSDFPRELSQENLDRSAVKVSLLLKEFEEFAAKKDIAGIFIIDACRDDPRGKAVSSIGGIVAVSPPAGAIVLYSAGARQIALEKLHEGDMEATSLYTRNLLKFLKPEYEALPVEVLAKAVRWDVYQVARDEAKPTHMQVPAYIDEMLERRNILGRRVPLPPYTPPVPSPPPRSEVTATPTTAAGHHGKGLGTEGSILRDCDQCPELVELPIGRFLIGSADGDPSGDPSEHPRTEINIGRRIAMGRYEVSRGEWLACQMAEACSRRIVALDEPGNSLRRPIAGISWDEALAYVGWLNRFVASKDATAARYRLPSEAEWEYAARAGSTGDYAFGNDSSRLCQYANGADASLKSFLWTNPKCKDGYMRGMAQIDAFAPNAFGLHSMHGNVWEWTADCYAPNHAGIDITGKARIGDGAGCKERVARGGSWRSGPWALRSARRIGLSQSHMRPTLGFRVALDLDPPL